MLEYRTAARRIDPYDGVASCEDAPFVKKQSWNRGLLNDGRLCEAQRLHLGNLRQ